MDCDEFFVGIVVKSDLVCDVHTNTVSDNSFAALDVPDDELVIVLTAERSQILLIIGEMEILDEHFMEFETM